MEYTFSLEAKATSGDELSLYDMVVYYDLDRWGYDAYDQHGFSGVGKGFIRKPTSDSPLYAGKFERKDYTGGEQPNGA